MSVSPAAMLRPYLWALMGGLLIQGLGSLVLRLNKTLAATVPYLVGGVLGIDAWHALIHIAWGFVGLVLLLQSPPQATLARLALIFGVFYSALAILGVVVYHPFGLELDLPENLFHWIAGPSTLVLGLLTWRLPRVDPDMP